MRYQPVIVAFVALCLITGSVYAYDNLRVTGSGGSSSFASVAEVNTGTETAKAISPDSLAGSYGGTKSLSFYLTTSSSAYLAVNSASNTSTCFMVPSALNGMDMVTASAAHGAAGSGGYSQIQIRNQTQSADMLSTLIHIDSNELNSWTAVTSSVIDTGNDDIATGDRVCADVDRVETTPGLETQVILEFRLP